MYQVKILLSSMAYICLIGIIIMILWESPTCVSVQYKTVELIFVICGFALMFNVGKLNKEK